MCLPLMKMSGGRGATSYSSMVIGCVGELVRVNILTVSKVLVVSLMLARRSYI